MTEDVAADGFKQSCSSRSAVEHTILKWAAS